MFHGSLIDKAGDIFDTFEDLFNDLEDAVNDVIDMTIREILEDISDSIETLAAELKAAGKDVVGFIEAGGELFYLLGETLGEGLDFVKNAVVVAGTVITGEIYDFSQQLKGFIVDGIVFLYDVAESGWDLFYQGLESAGEFVKDAFALNPSILDNLWTNVKEFGAGILRLYEVYWRGIFSLAGDLLEMTLGRLTDYLVKLLKPIPFLGEYLSIAVQFVYDALTLYVLFIEFLLALPFLLTCLFSDSLFEDPDFDKLLPTLATYPVRPIIMGAIQVLPRPQKILGRKEIKYAILSDMHLFFEGRTDFHSLTGSDTIHLALLNKLADDGYYLIENGDVEDLWRRDPGSDDQLGGRGHAGRETNKMQFREIVQNNAELYDLIYEKFQSRNRYTRTVGNHDLEMRKGYMQDELHKIYPGTNVFEFVLIGDGKNVPEFIIGHGHQVDLFNRKGCEWFGSLITRGISMFEEWWNINYKMSVETEDLASIVGGRDNILENHPAPVVGSPTLDENKLYWDYARMNSKMDLPGIIFGHSHDPKMFPGFVNEGEQISVWTPSKAASPYKSRGYLNSGTVGMWEGVIWFITLESDPAGAIISLLKAASIITMPTSIDHLVIYTFKSVYRADADNPGQIILPVGDPELISI